MTMAMGRDDVEAPPISARERAIPFGPMAEMDLTAIADPARTHQASGFWASRSEHLAAVSRLAPSRKPQRAVKSP